MAHGIPILTFHAVEEGDSVLVFPPCRFARALGDLSRAGWRAVTLAEAVAALAGEQPLPERVFALTFDDGYRSVFDAALPALCEHGVPATVFVATGGAPTEAGRLAPMQGRERLSWSEMREMRDLGVDFGAHTESHPDLRRLGAEDVEAEMRRSKQRLEDELAAPVRWFAYPFGRFDRRSRDLAASLFVAAFSDRLGLARRRDDRWTLPRVETYYLRRAGAFAGLSEGGLARRLALRNVPRRLRRLVSGRG